MKKIVILATLLILAAPGSGSDLWGAYQQALLSWGVSNPVAPSVDLDAGTWNFAEDRSSAPVTSLWEQTLQYQGISNINDPYGTESKTLEMLASIPHYENLGGGMIGIPMTPIPSI